MSSSFEIRLVINYIKRMTPKARSNALYQLLGEFSDEWLDEAYAIAEDMRALRKFARTGQG